MNKEEIEEAKKKFNKPKKYDLIEIIRIFKRNGIENYCVAENKTMQTLLQYIDQLENQIQATEMEHKYDIKMIDEVKGESVKLYKEIRKQNKMIDEMAEQLAGLTIWNIEKNEPLILGDKEEVKQYFEKKVEEK